MSDQQAKLSEQEMKTYRVQGFTCANCAGKFENNVKQLSGVEDATVNFGWMRRKLPQSCQYPARRVGNLL